MFTTYSFTQIEKKNEESSKSKNVSAAGEKVVESLDKNDEGQLAKSYEELAQKFIDKQNYTKGELYLKKALASYKKLQQSEDIARVSRSLAKVQEKLNKKEEAKVYYDIASNTVLKASDRKINQSDASRLNANSSAFTKTEAVNSNIRSFKKQMNKKELQDAYNQKADLYLFQNNYKGAIDTYTEAISIADNNYNLIVQLKNKIANVYVLSLEYDKAITLHKALLDEAKRKGRADIEVQQLRHISAIYFKTGENDKAIVLLKSAYKLALETGNTKAVKECLSRLLNYYKKIGNDKESLALYDSFFQNLDELIRSDSTLMDINTFQVIEEKIKQLEKEKRLKDRLIENTNTFNYFLIGSLLILLILIGMFIKALFSIKKRNKKIALQSLRREMNPHFIFNSLNSVNQFISQNNELEANKYLTSYSNLMRSIMENSSKDFITLAVEVELVKKYLDLELMRFANKFDFTISVDNSIDLETSYIPNMLIQPNLENAIWHGLRYLDGKGLLQLKVVLKDNQICVTIDDNGIGITKSRALKTLNQKAHDSLGLKNTQERIDLLNDLYHTAITFSILEKNAPEQGTLVEIRFPLIDKLP